jgi:predicted nucleic acid-binding Zn ribbon protein
MEGFIKDDPQKIGDLVRRTIDKMGYSDRLEKQSAVEKWGDVVGDSISAETKALKIDGDILVVKVFKPAWRQQLIFLKEELLEKLGAELGEGRVRDIRFI